MKNLLKKLLSSLLALQLITGIIAIPVFAEDDIKVLLDGKELTFDVPPQIINDRTMVPMRAIFEALGYEVDWNQENQSVFACNEAEDKMIYLIIDNPIIVSGSYSEFLSNPDVEKFAINNSITLTDSLPSIVAGRTLVPVRAISEASGCNVEWDGTAKKVTIADQKTNKSTSQSTNSISLVTIGKVFGVNPTYSAENFSNGFNIYNYTYQFNNFTRYNLAEYKDMLTNGGFSKAAVTNNEYSEKYVDSNNIQIGFTYNNTAMLVEIKVPETLSCTIDPVGYSYTPSSSQSGSTYYTTEQENTTTSENKYLNAQIASAQEKIKTIKSQITSIENQISDKEEELKNIQANRDTQIISGNRTVMVADPEKIAKVEEEIATLKNYLEYYQDILKEAQNYLKELKALKK